MSDPCSAVPAGTPWVRSWRLRPTWQRRADGRSGSAPTPVGTQDFGLKPDLRGSGLWDGIHPDGPLALWQDLPKPHPARPRPSRRTDHRPDHGSFAERARLLHGVTDSVRHLTQAPFPRGLGR
jgi:hypothetical protein